MACCDLYIYIFYIINVSLRYFKICVQLLIPCQWVHGWVCVCVRVYICVCLCMCARDNAASPQLEFLSHHTPQETLCLPLLLYGLNVVCFLVSTGQGAHLINTFPSSGLLLSKFQKEHAWTVLKIWVWPASLCVWDNRWECFLGRETKPR